MGRYKPTYGWFILVYCFTTIKIHNSAHKIHNVGPPSYVCWFINPMKTIVIGTINHSYWRPHIAGGSLHPNRTTLPPAPNYGPLYHGRGTITISVCRTLATTAVPSLPRFTSSVREPNTTWPLEPGGPRKGGEMAGEMASEVDENMWTPG